MSPRLWIRAQRALVALTVIAFEALIPLGVHAQSITDPLAKLAPELKPLVTATTGPTLAWVRNATGGVLVKVIVTIDPSRPLSVSTLLPTVLSLGGVVGYQYPSLHAVAVTLPAPKLLDLLRLAEVQSISPNRSVYRSSASLLERSSGAWDMRSASSANGNLTGSGIGIAVLDSGIAYTHRHFAGKGLLGLPGPTRVRQALDLAALGKSLSESDWIGGKVNAASGLLALQSGSLQSLLAQRSKLTALQPDAYGHGTHVASIAAGDGGYQGPDTTGVATDADLFDIRVLDDNGHRQPSPT